MMMSPSSQTKKKPWTAREKRIRWCACVSGGNSNLGFLPRMYWKRQKAFFSPSSPSPLVTPFRPRTASGGSGKNVEARKEATSGGEKREKSEVGKKRDHLLEFSSCNFRRHLVFPVITCYGIDRGLERLSRNSCSNNDPIWKDFHIGNTTTTTRTSRSSPRPARLRRR